MQSATQLFIDAVMANPVNIELFNRLPSLGLNECFLTAGCLFQATWNRISGQPVGWGVKAHDSPHLSDRPENISEERLVLQHL
jgi:uncharacterized protein